MKLVAIADAEGEAEALMYQAMLKEQGIKSFINLPSNQQFLRTNYGGASLPFDTWVISVSEIDALKASEILPSPKPKIEQSSTVHQRFPNPHRQLQTPASRFARWYLIFIGVPILIALIEMIKYFKNL